MKTITNSSVWSFLVVVAVVVTTTDFLSVVLSSVRSVPASEEETDENGRQQVTTMKTVAYNAKNMTRKRRTIRSVHMILENAQDCSGTRPKPHLGDLLHIPSMIQYHLDRFNCCIYQEEVYCWSNRVCDTQCNWQHSHKIQVNRPFFQCCPQKQTSIGWNLCQTVFKWQPWGVVQLEREPWQDLSGKKVQQ